MRDPQEEFPAEVARRADRMGERLNDTARSFSDAARNCEAEYAGLLQAVSRLGPRFAFDREGRPGAIEAVREALPLAERDLFDAILEDHACEVAAVEEALYQLALALRR